MGFYYDSPRPPQFSSSAAKLSKFKGKKKSILQLRELEKKKRTGQTNKQKDTAE